MTLLNREDDDEEKYAQDDDENYENMSDEEFWETIRSENAEHLGVSEEEIDDMSFREIEKQLGIDVSEPRFPQGSREGYRDVGSYNVLSKEDYQKRKNAVNNFLGSDFFSE